jgi:hypothetical protein
VKLPVLKVAYSPQLKPEAGPIVMWVRAWWSGKREDDQVFFLTEDEALTIRQQLTDAVKAMRAAADGRDNALLSDDLLAGDPPHGASAASPPIDDAPAPAMGGDFFSRRRLADG